MRDKLAKVQKAPAPAAASKGGAKGGAAAGAAAPSSTVRGISVTDPAPVQQPPKDWSAVTVAEAGAAQARVALLLQENAKLTEALRDVKEQVVEIHILSTHTLVQLLNFCCHSRLLTIFIPYPTS